MKFLVLKDEEMGLAAYEIIGNDASGNTKLDCHDESVGTGTAGTANAWQDDHGQTSSPSGICQA